MSEEASKGFQEAQRVQINRNQARNIWYHVQQARGHTASVRWPFELFQNALDAGPRPGRQSIGISIRRSDSALVFQHDGAPFTCDELAALLSGGSSKELQSADTTGRFGTGYLVTHVLSERVRLIGLLQVGSGIEQFDLDLNRSGDESAILENIELCSASITAAEAISDIEKALSATFEYPLRDSEPIDTGVAALRRALPYVYATRPKLGQVVVETDDGTREVWTPGQLTSVAVYGGWLEYRSLVVEQQGSIVPERRIYKFMTKQEAASSALVLLERTERGWRVITPGEDAPRVYREYPLSGSDFVPINFVIDGKFDPDEQRRAPQMTDDGKDLLVDALAAGVLAVKYAFDQKWEKAHWIARVLQPLSAFNPADTAEKQWWVEQLKVFAQALASLPIVECTTGVLPAVADDGSFADFVMPRLLPSSAEDETTVQQMWPVVRGCTELDPPKKELAEDWTAIAKGWHSLGVEVSLISVKDLADWVRDEATTLSELKVTDDKKDWLVAFLDIVGECWTKRKGIEPVVLENILPNQNQNLCSPTKLVRDISISEPLKDICAEAGYDVRDRLFIGGLNDIAQMGALKYFSAAVTGAVTGTLSEEQVIEELLKHLSAKLPDNKDCEEESSTVQEGSVRLLSHLWKTKGDAAASIARQVPLITSKQRAVRWSHDRMMIAPVRNWHQSAQPFAKAYPEQRILADLYLGSQDGQIPDVVPALVGWGMAFADPLTVDTPSGLSAARLPILGLGDTDGVTVSNVGDQKFSQLALLQPEVLNRCQEGTEEAYALLGLVLCYIAPNDSGWREQRIVKGRKAGQDVAITVRGSLWVADLQIRAWVPVPGEDGQTARAVATADTLKGMVNQNPSWLQGNEAAIRLLSECFHFDELDLRLLGIEAERLRDLRNGLAKLVEFGGPDPGFYTTLLEEAEAQKRRSRDVGRCRKLGLAVQEAVKLAMEKHKLKLDLIDRGFDYTVDLQTGNVLEDGATTFEMGPYLLEVKSTARGDARLTPLQADTASKEQSRFVLCVVDLRGLTDDLLDAEWTAARVDPLAKIVTDIGAKTGETYSLILDATTKSVGARNESALRYEVPVSEWETGMTISEWVKKVSSIRRKGAKTKTGKK